MAKDANPKKLNWADMMDEEEEGNGDDDFALLFPFPPRQVIGPDENGIKKVIEYKFNEAINKIVKVTTTIRVHKVVTKMNKKATERRRSWDKFGDAVDDGEALRKLTSVSSEDVFLELKAKGVDESRDDLGKLGSRGGILILCRTCGKKGDHFTTKCPYKDLGPVAPQSEPLKTERPCSANGASRYLPPRRRNGGEHHEIRVTNLSEDAQESDIRDLFYPFGTVARVCLPRDGRTGLNRGFCFVSFVNKEDAEKAVNTLDGYGYDNLILRVERSVPRSK